MLTEPVLPPNVSSADFASAIDELRGVVGEANVFVDLEQLVPYSKIMMPVDNALHQPSGVVAATTVEEIQAILAICNRYVIPIWTISTGRNFGYGSAAPATAGQLVLDLRRMNRILEVDAELGTVLLEPGVTFQELHDYLHENNIPLWYSHPSSGPLASPVGNALDRGVGYNRMNVNVDSICGMEIVLANGEVIRTGMGGVAGTSAWQAYKFGFGPSLDGLFQQSNFGIVTKVGMWLQPKPETYKMVMVAIDSEENFAKGVDIQRQLRLQMVTENGLMSGGAAGLSMMMPREKIYDGEGAIPDEILRQFLGELGAPPYSYICNLYGTQEQVETNFRIIQQKFEGVGKAMAFEPNQPPESPMRHYEIMTTSQLDLHEFGMYNYRGAGGGNLWFAPVIPAKGQEVVESMKLNKRVCAEYGFEYIGGFVFGPRWGEHVMAIPYDRTDPDETQKAYDCFDALLKANSEAGYAPYRVNTAFMKQTAQVFGPEQSRMNARLKNLFDPNGILAPGKSGIGG